MEFQIYHKFYTFKEFSNDVENDNNNAVPYELSEVLSTTALSVLYNSEYINGRLCCKSKVIILCTQLLNTVNKNGFCHIFFTGNGFFLYSKEQIQIDGQNQCNGTGPKHVLIETSSPPPSLEYEEPEDDTPVQVIIVSLWYWW